MTKPNSCIRSVRRASRGTRMSEGPPAEAPAGDPPAARPPARAAVDVRSLVARYVPIVRWLPAYDRGDLRFDAIAGIVSWGVMVPVAMAYAGLAGMPPEAGLVTAFAALTAYALFGTSRHIKVTASSSVAIMSASVVVAAGARRPGRDDRPERGAGAHRRDHPDRGRGRAARVPVAVPGGVGGHRLRDRPRGHDHRRPDPGPARHPAGERHDHREARRDRRQPRRGPGLHGRARDRLGDRDVRAQGASRRGSPAHSSRWWSGSRCRSPSTSRRRAWRSSATCRPACRCPSIPQIPFGDVVFLVAGAFGIVFLALAESIGAARSFAVRHGYEIDPDQELIALGAANAGAGLFGGFSVDASFSQSATGEAAGNRTQVSSLIAAALDPCHRGRPRADLRRSCPSRSCRPSSSSRSSGWSTSASCAATSPGSARISCWR